MLLTHLVAHTTTIISTANVHHLALQRVDPPPTTVSNPAAASGNSFSDIYAFAQTVRTLITDLGLVVFFIGISVAGMLRVMSFGSERRIAVSNMALTAAIIGLAIILGANGIYTLVNTAFFHAL